MTLTSLAAEAQTPFLDHYHAFDNYAPTREECEFLYALVRLQRPTLVVEAGTGTGISGAFIAEALAENGDGRLVTYEDDERCVNLAGQRLHALPAKVVLGDSRQHDPANVPDLVFIDSQPLLRRDDIGFWLHGGYTGLVVIHDANREYPETLGRGLLLPGASGFWLGYGG